MFLNKKVLGGFVVGIASLVLGATAFAAGTPAPDAVGAPVPTISPTIVVPPVLLLDSPCPDGWHLVPGTVSGDQFSCVPTKTTQMIECPIGLVYYDDGCTIGCEVPIK